MANSIYLLAYPETLSMVTLQNIFHFSLLQQRFSVYMLSNDTAKI